MKRVEIVSAIFLLFLFLTSVIVFGETITKTIQVTYRNISILVNGKIIPSEQEPFIYQGRTFVPLRTIGEAVNKTVEWDNAKNQVSITDKPTNTTQSFLRFPLHKLGERVEAYPFALTLTKIYHGYTNKLGSKTIDDLLYVDVTLENISDTNLDIALSMPFSIWEKNSGKIAFLYQSYLHSLQLPAYYKSTSDAYVSQKQTDEMKNKNLILVFSPVEDGYRDKFNNVFLAFDLGKIE